MDSTWRPKSTRSSQRTRRGRTAVKRGSQSRRANPGLERLDIRALPAVAITAFNVAAGTVTFTGDAGSKNDSLQLSETQVGTDSYLTHDLKSTGNTGNYA